MKANRPNQRILGNRVKRSIQRLIKHPAGNTPMGGFCFCPRCKHLVFDTALNGNCPHCGAHFCASCVTEKF